MVIASRLKNTYAAKASYVVLFHLTLAITFLSARWQAHQHQHLGDLHDNTLVCNSYRKEAA